jgi:hypothetical protein
MHRNQKLVATKFALLLLVLAPTATAATGCAAAAVGAAGGAVGAIAYTDRGAEGVAKGEVHTVNQQSRAVLKNMGLQITGSEMKEAGKEQELTGKKTGMTVTVKMTHSTAGTTHIEVIAQESTFKWNKDYAKDVLARIVNRG